jgi:hypothetical protein
LTTVDDAREQGQPLADLTKGHEANSMQVRGLVFFAIALIGVTVLVFLIVALVMHDFRREEKQAESTALPRFAGDTGEFASPRIQANAAAELARMKKEDLERLSTFGWIDRAAGIAHIPVDRAIDILADKGLPEAPPAAAATSSSAKPAEASAEAERAKLRPVPERKP